LTGIAVKVTCVPWQTVLADAPMETLTGNDDDCDKTIWFEVTGLVPLMQLALEVSLHVTASPLSGEHEKAGEAAGGPEATPFTNHWYNGAVPPFVAVAAKSTEVPWQNGLVNVVMVTLAGMAEFTDMVTGAEVTGLLLAQAALEVILQVTASPLTGE